jgi:hypothetical protein
MHGGLGPFFSSACGGGDVAAFEVGAGAAGAPRWLCSIRRHAGRSVRCHDGREFPAQILPSLTCMPPEPTGALQPMHAPIHIHTGGPWRTSSCAGPPFARSNCRGTPSVKSVILKHLQGHGALPPKAPSPSASFRALCIARGPPKLGRLAASLLCAGGCWSNLGQTRSNTHAFPMRVRVCVTP